MTKTPKTLNRKNFIRAEKLSQNSSELGFRIIESGYRPTFILGVWSGGAQVEIAIQELLELYGYTNKLLNMGQCH